jgi:hypothetical protein
MKPGRVNVKAAACRGRACDKLQRQQHKSKATAFIKKAVGARAEAMAGIFGAQQTGHAA